MVIFSIALVFASLFPTWELSPSGVNTSIRGLDAVDEEVCWFGTRNGVARTIDGGKSWRFTPIESEKAEVTFDFRDVEAFDGERCVAMSAGEGEASRIYRTDDGGKNWKEVQRNRFPKGFYNGMAFVDTRRGILAGDAVDGRLFVLSTGDGGATWKRLSAEQVPEMQKGEHAFAASGSHLSVGPDRRVLVTSGGTIARVFRSADWGTRWEVADTPMISGEPSTGIFSIAFSPDDRQIGFAVGGDYEKEKEGTKNLMRTRDGGGNWTLVREENGGSPVPFQSCIAFVDRDRLVSTGPAGSRLSTDGGRTWAPLGNEGFHVLSVVGEVVWAAGAEGRVGRWRLKG